VNPSTFGQVVGDAIEKDGHNRLYFTIGKLWMLRSQQRYELSTNHMVSSTLDAGALGSERRQATVKPSTNRALKTPDVHIGTQTGATVRDRVW
jgi:hypothetical protein